MKRLDGFTREDVLEIIIEKYLSVKRDHKVFNREESPSLSYARGQITGACMMMELDTEETEDEFVVVTNTRRKVILRVDKTPYNVSEDEILY